MRHDNKIQKTCSDFLRNYSDGIRTVVLLYAVFGMNGDEEIRAKKTIAQHDTSVDPEKPMVALTYDDGPYTPVTGRILESLKAVGGRATFLLSAAE